MALTLQDELRCGIGFLRQEIKEDTMKKEAMIRLLQEALNVIEGKESDKSLDTHTL